jgi:membrane protease YdiL (CAAX protease family)
VRPGGPLDGLLPMPLRHVVDVEHRETVRVQTRRRLVVGVTTVAGAVLLGRSLATPPGSPAFYRRTATVAAVWTLGGLASGPLHLGWIENRDARLRRPLLTPIATGVGAFGIFLGGAVVARRIPILNASVAQVLEFADAGEDRLILLTTLANGLGEEIFFRGALYAAVGGDRRAVAVSTAVYTLATTTTRNPALALAAATMGTLFGLQRRASRGLQAPTITHLTWSVLMLRFVPPLYRDRRAGRPGSVRA